MRVRIRSIEATCGSCAASRAGAAHRVVMKDFEELEQPAVLLRCLLMAQYDERSTTLMARSRKWPVIKQEKG
jgi:hypothetical protein